MLDAAVKELAQGTNFGTLAVHLPSGGIMSHVMWVDADDDHIVINTEVHRAKFKAMEANPNVTVTIWAATNPYSFAEVRGTVVETIRGDEARAHIDTVSQKYTGAPYAREVESERVIVKIAPTRQLSR